MLRFACKPDTVFTTIISDSLDLAMDAVKIQGLKFDCYWLDEYTYKLFGSREDILLNEMQKLYAANKSDELFMPTDFHFRLLDRVLDWYCDIYNDSVDNETLLVKKGKKPVTHLDIDSIRSTFFWDCDYELFASLEVQAGSKQLASILDMAGLTLSGKNIQRGNSADFKDLTLEKCTPDEDWGRTPMNFWFT